MSAVAGPVKQRCRAAGHQGGCAAWRDQRPKRQKPRNPGTTPPGDANLCRNGGAGGCRPLLEPFWNRYFTAPVATNPLSTATIGENIWLMSWISFDGWFEAALPMNSTSLSRMAKFCARK